MRFARQPIMMISENGGTNDGLSFPRIGYELFFRSSGDATERTQSGLHASRMTMIQAAGCLAGDWDPEANTWWVNIDAEDLFDEALMSQLVDLRFAVDVVGRCSGLKERLTDLKRTGILVTLDDATASDADLFDSVFFVKPNCQEQNLQQIAGLIERMEPTARPQLLVKNIETGADLARAVEVGAAGGQGWYLAQTEEIRPWIYDVHPMVFDFSLRAIQCYRDSEGLPDVLAIEFRQDPIMMLRVLGLLSTPLLGEERKSNPYFSVASVLRRMTPTRIEQWLKMLSATSSSDRSLGDVYKEPIVAHAAAMEACVSYLWDKEDCASRRDSNGRTLEGAKDSAFVLGIIEKIPEILHVSLGEVVKKFSFPDGMQRVFSKDRSCLLLRTMILCKQYEGGLLEDRELTQALDEAVKDRLTALKSIGRTGEGDE